ncbi:MAG: hypothetical protein WAZ18_01460 [Alphaproteobacteria bacterium]
MKPLIAILFAPLLLAPVYYQGGTAKAVGEQVENNITDLPAAAPLTSPLLVTPTLEEPALPAVAPEEEVTEPVPAPKGVLDAATCARGLEVMQDMASLAYQKESRSVYMGIIVAAGIARQQVASGDTPNLAVVRKRLHAIPWGAVLRDELLNLYVLIEVPCTPTASAAKIKTKPSVERPD